MTNMTEPRIIKPELNSIERIEKPLIAPTKDRSSLDRLIAESLSLFFCFLSVRHECRWTRKRFTLSSFSGSRFRLKPKVPYRYYCLGRQVQNTLMCRKLKDILIDIISVHIFSSSIFLTQYLTCQPASCYKTRRCNDL